MFDPLFHKWGMQKHINSWPPAKGGVKCYQPGNLQIGPDIDCTILVLFLFTM